MKVGDYVRTPNGGIAKIIDIQDEEGQYFVNNNAVSLKSKTYIADKNITIGESFKHSPNIIDLIEVGDIVKIEYQGWHQVSTKFETLKFFDDEGTEYLYDEIRAIITKEQIENMEYKVGD